MEHTLKNNPKLKLNGADQYDSITVSLANFPVAYNLKLKELVDEAGMSEAEAKQFLRESPIELELYYHYGYGLFAVEAEAVDAGANIYSPYNTERYEDADE